jgi:hypothetical protein
MMNLHFSRKAIYAAFGMSLLLASCGITGGNNGNDEAALSCTQDLTAGLTNAKIVSIGMKQRTVGEVKDATTDIEVVRKRAILSAQAAAANTYWQPLADAWALNEALLQAIIDSGLTPDTGTAYFEFIRNVNLDYAATSKDTYCRIAFSKKGIVINYEADAK